MFIYRRRHRVSRWSILSVSPLTDGLRELKRLMMAYILGPSVDRIALRGTIGGIVSTLTFEEMRLFIEQSESIQELNILLGVGLRGGLFFAASKRILELRARGAIV